MAKHFKNVKYIMDASAIIAVANQEQHIPNLSSLFMESIITTINLAEALTIIIQRFKVDPDTIWNKLSNFVQNHYPVDDELTYEVVKMAPYAKQYQLSMGDQYCLALAKKLQLPVYTAKQSWQEMGATLGISVVLIR